MYLIYMTKTSIFSIPVFCYDVRTETHMCMPPSTSSYRLLCSTRIAAYCVLHIRHRPQFDCYLQNYDSVRITSSCAERHMSAYMLSAPATATPTVKTRQMRSWQTVVSGTASVIIVGKYVWRHMHIYMLQYVQTHVDNVDMQFKSVSFLNWKLFRSSTLLQWLRCTEKQLQKYCSRHT